MADIEQGELGQNQVDPIWCKLNSHLLWIEIEGSNGLNQVQVQDQPAFSKCPETWMRGDQVE